MGNPDPHATNTALVQCQPGCGACCIAPAISSPLPGMPQGKPAGVRCAQLDANNACCVFGQPERPAVCAQFAPQAGLCTRGREHALQQLTWLERATDPGQVQG